jgi:lysophospholipase L1-like esterase
MNLSLRPCLRLLILALATLPALAYATKPTPAPDHWVGTWATANVADPAPKNGTGFATGAADVTLRQIVHTSLAGALVRVEFTNAFGTDPLTIGAAHIALAAPGGNTTGDIALASANALTFNGQSSITIPAGGEVVSDPAALTLPTGADLVVSLFLPAQKISIATRHGSAYQTNFAAAGNVVGERTLSTQTPQTMSSWYFLKSVDVKTPADTAAIVAFGDSITDGTASTPNTNQRWPDLLARRLQSGKETRNLAVLNEGIGGNRVLNDGWGPNALARFDRDVLSLPGVRYLILLESINDLGHSFDPKKPYDPVTAESLEAGLSQLAERAHVHGIKVIGATLTPYLGASYSSPAGDQVRQAVNAWIRTAKVFDGVVDFDKATQNAASPTDWNPTFDHGDHLHPSDAGMKAMADSIDLKLFYPAK